MSVVRDSDLSMIHQAAVRNLEVASKAITEARSGLSIYRDLGQPKDQEGFMTIEVVAKQELARRRQREAIFSSELFSDPAWDMLLDLFINNSNRIAVSDLCIASQAPATTALRWIDVLIEEQLIEKERDPSDRRGKFVVLTERGYEKMTNYLYKSANMQS